MDMNLQIYIYDEIIYKLWVPKAKGLLGFTVITKNVLHFFVLFKMRDISEVVTVYY